MKDNQSAKENDDALKLFQSVISAAHGRPQECETCARFRAIMNLAQDLYIDNYEPSGDADVYRIKTFHAFLAAETFIMIAESKVDQFKKEHAEHEGALE